MTRGTALHRFRKKISSCLLAASAYTGLAVLLTSASLNAAELKPESLAAWNNYIETTKATMQTRLHDGHRFFWVDEDPDRIAQVRGGKIVAAPVGAHNPQHIPSGLIHHWIGAVFIPNARIEDVFGVTRNYERYKEFYKPVVLDAKAENKGNAEDRFSIRLMNKALISKTALESEYVCSYGRVDENRWYSVTYTTRTQEIQSFGQPNEQRMPPDKGKGFIWRLHSDARFQERDGGVLLEIEAMVLSRDVPATVRLFVDPIVRRVSRDAIVTSLQQTEQAVESMPAVTKRQLIRSPLTAQVSGQ